MKASFLLFFLTAIAIYAVGNYYMYVRGWQALEILGRCRVWYTVAFWVLASLFILSNVIRLPGSHGWLDILHTIGSFWISIMLYGFLALVLIDLVRFAGWIGSIEPNFIYANYPVTKLVLFGVVCVALFATLTWGYKNARYPDIVRLEIPVAKQAGHLKDLRIAVVSDIHLGHVTGQKFLKRVVDNINELDVDLVLLAGDTFDGNPDPVIGKDMGVEFERLKSKYGVYAVSGNHEHIGGKGGAKKAFDYLASRGVTPLIDSTVLIDNSFYIVGRNDYSIQGRKSLNDLLAASDKKLPVIMLDHQPFHFEEAEQAGVDLQLSGHTHHGQMWPLNYVTQKMYETDWGYLQKGNTHYYVSCGVGVWGPITRTAGHSEIILVHMTFDNGLTK